MALSDTIVCLKPMSKDMRGELDLVESELEQCEKLDCETLEARHRFKFEVGGAGECDSEIGRLLDGVLYGTLTHKFVDGNGMRRGVHEGSWRLKGAVVASGRLTGVTNAGTHREPVFEPCQKCEAPGVMEGMLTGTIRGPETSDFLGCRIRCAYRIRFDPSKSGGDGAASGTLEGALVCTCPS
ncbi:MAG TPA: hypothetical protein VF529_04650 [Solirubrobacteraceae bacterium]|jgi:hypothetical protein